MPETVRNFLSKKLAEVREEGWTMAAISREMGRNPTYLQQYLKKGVPEELAEQERRLLASILKCSQELLVGKGKPHRPRPLRLRQAFVHDSVSSGPEFTPLHGVTTPSRLVELPVYQAVQEGDGSVTIARRPFARMLMPPALNLGPKAYAVTIADDAMEPEHCRGSTALVDPELEPKVDTTCLFRECASNVILIRRIKEITDTEWHVAAHNGPAKGRLLKLAKAKYEQPHVTIGNIFRIT